MTTYDIVKKLTGEIRPSGESTEDEKRLDNLQLTGALVELLLSDILDTAQFHDSKRASEKQLGIAAKEILNRLISYGV